MQQFVNFVIGHWFLWSLVILILALLLWNELRTQVGGVTRVHPQQAVQLINHQNAMVLDVRGEEPFKNGHILGAKNIPISELPNRISKIQKYKLKPVLLVCDAGQQSLKAGASLKQNGFTQIYNLFGGLKAWQQAGLPLTTQMKATNE